VRWALFCAVRRRKFAKNLNWAPYFAIADSDRSPEEKLEAYAAIAEEKYEVERFEEFCAKHLAHLPELANEFFASDTCRDAIRQKVAALFPPHEHEEFTQLFFD